MQRGQDPKTHTPFIARILSQGPSADFLSNFVKSVHFLYLYRSQPGLSLHSLLFGFYSSPLTGLPISTLNLRPSWQLQ